jgi:hypothetical protein
LVTIGSADVFVSKLDGVGVWMWAIRCGGTSSDSSNVGISENKNLYIGGGFSLTATFGVHTVTSAGSSDIFVAKINPIGPNTPCILLGSGSDTSYVSVAHGHGLRTSVSGLTDRQDYYLNYPTSGLTTVRSDYYLGYSDDSNTLIFNPKS